MIKPYPNMLRVNIIYLFIIIIDFINIINCIKNDDDINNKYSLMQCTGGNQDIHSSQFFKYFDYYPHAHISKVRTCKFQNVCYINGQVTYYIDDSNIIRNLYNPSIFTLNSFIRGRNINVVKSSLPTDIPFSEEKYIFLFESDKGYNFVR